VASCRARRAWIFAIAVVVAAVCVRLGFWQLDRLQQRRAFNDAVRAGQSAAPERIDVLVDQSQGQLDVLAYRRAEASGRYDPSHEVIMYGRTLDDEPGNHVLTPLALGGDVALLVDRGWVPLEADTAPIGGELAPPSGHTTVVGTLLPPDRMEPPEPDASPVATVSEVDLAVLDEQMPYRLLPVYLLASQQDPPQAGGLPAPAPLSELTEGPHLSYAVQWFGFAAIALVGSFLLARRDRRRYEPVSPADGPHATNEP
jgi:surfeit locus 1 family protein